MNRCHKTLLDPERIVDDFGERCQAIGSTGGVGNNGMLSRVVLVVVDAHNEHCCVLGGCRDDNLLGTTLEMGAGLGGLSEDTSRLTDVVSTNTAPLDLVSL